MNFANVTDIKIPEGLVTKIEETSGLKRVLWQKGLPIPKAHWEIVELPNADSNEELYYPLLTFVDTEDGIEIFKRTGGQHFKYRADGTAESIYTFQDTPTIKCADIDPVSKRWIAFGSDYASNAFSGTKALDGSNKLICCWSPKLECFCAISSRDAVVVNLNGEIQGTSQEVPFSAISGGRRDESLIWADSLDKFVIPETTGTNNYVCFSSDGLNWETKTIILTGEFPDISADYTRITMYQIRWMPTMKKFVSVCRVNASDSYKEYIVKSSDCQRWECVGKYMLVGSAVETTLSYSSDKKVLAVDNLQTSYVTRDLENWVEVPFIDGMPQGNSARTMKWSQSLNCFVRFGTESNPRFYKLVIDN